MYQKNGSWHLIIANNKKNKKKGNRVIHKFSEFTVNETGCKLNNERAEVFNMYWNAMKSMEFSYTAVAFSYTSTHQLCTQV